MTKTTFKTESAPSKIGKKADRSWLILFGLVCLIIVLNFILHNIELNWENLTITFLSVFVILLILYFLNRWLIKTNESTQSILIKPFIVGKFCNYFKRLKDSLIINRWYKKRWNIKLKNKKSETQEDKGYYIIERYVLIWFIISIVIWILFSIIGIYSDQLLGFLGWNFYILIAGILSLIPLYRIYEIIVYQSNVLLFDYIRNTKNDEPYYLGGYTRLIILLIIGYFTIIFCFAGLYAIFNMDFCLNVNTIIYPNISGINSFFASLYHSVVTMSSLGHGDIIPKSDYGRLLSSLHSIIAIFMNLILIARFVSLLPKPITRDKTENKYLKILKEANGKVEDIKLNDKIKKKLDKIYKNKK